MDTGGSSKAFDAFALREDLEYMRASNVNVSNFVSVKLSGTSNYKIWKEQMLCLLKSQALLYIVDAGCRSPGDKGVNPQYDQLVKGWIFGSVKENVLRDLVGLGTAQEVWMKLESLFNLPVSDTKGDSSNALGVSAPDDVVYAMREDVKYLQALNVDVSNFVSAKLMDERNYYTWKNEMLYLIGSHELLPIIHAEESRFPWNKDDPMTQKYDSLVRGWILSTMTDDERHKYIIYRSVQLMWRRLESTYTYQPETSDTKGYSRHEPVVTAATQDLKYKQTLNVNVSNFVSVKLSGHSNYEIWNVQMLCLIESQELLHHIDDKESDYALDKYDNLVKSWISSTMNEQLLKKFKGHFKNYYSAKEVWDKLKSAFDSTNGNSNREDERATSPGFEFRVPEIEDTDNIKIKKELYDGIVEGCWWKAKSILKIDKDAATKAINTIGDTILHLAVETGHNYFLEKLLDFLGDGEVIEKKNDMGRTALHIAAAVGNTHAAQLLVQKRSQLLQILDCDNESPFDIGYTNRKLDTCAYLLKSENFSDSLKSEYAIMSAILTKEYDLAESLLKKFQECAKRDERILLLLTLTFPSDLGFIESFVYPSFNNVHGKIIARCSFLFNPMFFDKCVDDILRVVKIRNNTCCSWLDKLSLILFVPIVTVYPIYQLICFLILLLRLTFSILYFRMWKVLAVTVHPIKNIEKKKKQYKEAKKILSLVCSQMGKLNNGYKDSLFEAVRQDTYEVVDEILLTSRATINCKDEEGYNIIQLAIMNRAEKVYSLLYHIIERTQSYREAIDFSKNNLLHLSGKLAPSFVLERTTGAALQLQRELLWREEVKKLRLPIDLRDVNNNKETPAMVFTREHRDLMKEGENWIKKTAESCSITAALIVTVVFAAAITVPGGSNQDSGIPVFKKEAAFTVFAVSNAFSLFTASTALLLYSSILTARFSEIDFLVSLPRRLIFGLLMLFLSTIAMMVAFGAIMFLVFCDKRPWMLAPICVFTCLPILVIVTVKLPLLVDLIRSTYFPIFGNRSYLESCSINRKKTIFTK